jgi:hypothetical protein
VVRVSDDLRANPLDVDGRLAAWDKKHAELEKARKAKKKTPASVLQNLLAKM